MKLASTYYLNANNNNVVFKKQHQDRDKNNILNKTKYSLKDNPVANLNKVNISFGAMKKSQFSEFDLIIVNKLKAPIEKFNTNEDFQNYCQEILDRDYLNENNLNNFCKARTQTGVTQKKSILQDWFKYATQGNDAYTPSIKLYILQSITHDLKANDDKLPPSFNARTLADTMEHIKNNSKTNLNFKKIYQNKAQEILLQEEAQFSENITGWVKIPSKIHDEANFKENVEKLKTLSHDSWCTKSYNAEPYLSKGDFHVYLEEGKPKLGVRFNGDEIAEIQGPKNNTIIPPNYFVFTNEYIESNNFKLTPKASYEIGKSEEYKKKYDVFIEKNGGDKLKEYLKTKNYEKILSCFGMEVKKDKDNMWILSQYHQPDKKFTFDDLGINEDAIFSKVKKITGDADFKGSQIKSLGNLKTINGKIEFYQENELIKEIAIEQMKNNIGEEYLKTKNYEKILSYLGTEVKTDKNGMMILSKYEQPSNTLCFSDLGIDENQLFKKIIGNADFSGSKLQSLGNLESIGGNAKFRYGKIQSLGKLKSLQGKIEYSNVNKKLINAIKIFEIKQNIKNFFKKIA